MKKQSQSGFAAVELIVFVLLLAAIVGVGYYVWNSHKTSPSTATTTGTSSNYQSPPTTVPTAPQVNKASDLSSAMAALNQTNITANSTDSSQLTTEMSSF